MGTLKQWFLCQYPWCVLLPLEVRDPFSCTKKTCKCTYRIGSPFLIFEIQGHFMWIRCSSLGYSWEHGWLFIVLYWNKKQIHRNRLEVFFHLGQMLLAADRLWSSCWSTIMFFSVTQMSRIPVLPKEIWSCGTRFALCMFLGSPQKTNICDTGLPSSFYNPSFLSSARFPKLGLMFDGWSLHLHLFPWVAVWSLSGDHWTSHQSRSIA